MVREAGIHLRDFATCAATTGIVILRCRKTLRSHRFALKPPRNTDVGGSRGVNAFEAETGIFRSRRRFTWKTQPTAVASARIALIYGCPIGRTTTNKSESDRQEYRGTATERSVVC